MARYLVRMSIDCAAVVEATSLDDAERIGNTLAIEDFDKVYSELEIEAEPLDEAWARLQTITKE